MNANDFHKIFPFLHFLIKGNYHSGLEIKNYSLEIEEAAMRTARFIAV